MVLNTHFYSISNEVYNISGAYLPIYYGHVETPQGKVLLAETTGRIIHFAPCETIEDEIEYFQERWSLSKPTRHDDHCQAIANAMYQQHAEQSIRILAMGTDFQIKVWAALHKIPFGEVRSYSEIAAAIGQPTATRAVSNAIGKNPIGLLLPCHRVIRNDGSIGGYRWGVESKRQLLNDEGHQADAFGDSLSDNLDEVLA